MTRAAAVAALSIVLAGCRTNEAPIGYTPRTPEETGRDDVPPTGGGGYEFGSKLDAVRAKCAAERGKLEQSGQVSVCTARHADAGATKITLVEYCSGAVCRVHSLVIVDRPDAESWLVPFDFLRRELRQRYGTPDHDKTSFPSECQTEFAECVKNGTASATLRWRWDDGHAVMLRLGSTQQVPAAISISYESPNAHAADR